MMGGEADSAVVRTVVAEAVYTVKIMHQRRSIGSINGWCRGGVRSWSRIALYENRSSMEKAMSIRTASLSLVLAAAALLVMPAPSANAAETASASKSFEHGAALLADADFEGALEAYAKAAKAEPNNQSYRQQYSLLSRVIKVRAGFEQQQNPVVWDRTAIALRAYYEANKIHGEALKVDWERHERTGTPETAVLLAESQLRLDLNEETVELLDELGDDQTPRAAALKGIALARLGMMDAAKKLAGECCPDGVKPDPALCFDLARLSSLIGDQEPAAKMLACCFEQTVPSQLGTLKASAEECVDLSKLVASGLSEKVWATKSLIKESGCSGGTSCGSCPSRGACSSGGEAKGCASGGDAKGCSEGNHDHDKK